MKIYVLIGQRKCSYHGEYAPELLDAVDELTDDDNPEYLTNKIEYYDSSNKFESIKLIQTSISDAFIDAALTGKISSAAIPAVGATNVKVRET